MAGGWRWVGWVEKCVSILVLFEWVTETPSRRRRRLRAPSPLLHLPSHLPPHPLPNTLAHPVSSHSPSPQEGETAPHGCGVAVVDETTTVYLLLSGILDANKELEKLGKKQADTQGKVCVWCVCARARACVCMALCVCIQKCDGVGSIRMCGAVGGHSWANAGRHAMQSARVCGCDAAPIDCHLPLCLCRTVLLFHALRTRAPRSIPLPHP